VAGWTRIPIVSIEDLSDAVLGADLDAVQMSGRPVTGSLAFATRGGVTFSSGSLDGRVAITGPLSQSMITVGVGVVLAPGTRHWLNELASGSIGVFHPGDIHDSLYAPGSIYAAATLSIEHLEELAARVDLVLDKRALGGTGISTKKVSGAGLARLENQFRLIHAERTAGDCSPSVAGEFLLQTIIAHLARPPRAPIGGINPKGLARIVAVARAFIHDNLQEPLSIEKIAKAASTSHRTLHRAFQAVLDEPPYSYVLRLRLHRIRRELISDTELACNVTSVASLWGISELGRFAGEYRDLFGELPSETLARIRHNTLLSHGSLAGFA
jgi:AraC-like DNA-binding protein